MDVSVFVEQMIIRNSFFKYRPYVAFKFGDS